jgi:predicted transcriptional regulator
MGMVALPDSHQTGRYKDYAGEILHILQESDHWLKAKAIASKLGLESIQCISHALGKLVREGSIIKDPRCRKGHYRISPITPLGA